MTVAILFCEKMGSFRQFETQETLSKYGNGKERNHL